MNDIEFKSTFDEIEYDIAMDIYMKHNSKIASIYDNLGDIYGYDDLEDAKALEEHDTLEEYKKALKEKCDAFDEVVEICKNYEKYKEQWFEEECKDALDDINTILRGE